VKGGAEVIYRRGKAYWYNFRWTIKNPDGTKESFRIVKSARAKNRDDAKDAEDEHRRALRLGQIHPRDPWPQPTTMDRFSLARLMGHSSPAVAARYYVHVTETHVAAGFGKFVEYQTRNVAEGIADAFPEASEAVQ
jgi:hypothetical protein